MCRESCRLTTAKLDNKTAAIPIKLKREQINALRLTATKMWKCAGKTTLPQNRDDGILQSLAHLFACVGHGVCVRVD